MSNIARAIWGTRAVVLALAAGVLLACEDGSAPEPAPAPVAAVVVVPADGVWTGVLQVGHTIALRARPLANDGSELSRGPAEWSSADTTIAVVNAAGVLEARRAGSTQINARIDGRTGGLAVQVLDAAAQVVRVGISPAAAVLTVGQTRVYSARAWDANDNEIMGRDVVWSTPSPDVIEIGPGGLVGALRPGYGEVRASIDGVTAAVGLTVSTPEPAPVTYVIVAPSATAVHPGEQVQLNAVTIGPTGGVVTGRQVTWVSENPQIATVTQNGVVQGVAKGTTRIRAISEGVTGFATVDVRNRPTGVVDTYQLVGTLLQFARVPYVEIGLTTWTDPTGIAHDAMLIVTAATLRLDGSNGRYSQAFTVQTLLVGGGPGQAPVQTRTVGDEGDLMYDFATGERLLVSTTSPGVVHRVQAGLAGEIIVRQSVLGTVAQPWLFVIQ